MGETHGLQTVLPNPANPEGVEQFIGPLRFMYAFLCNINCVCLYTHLNILKMGAYKQIFYHIIFGTKNREPTISTVYELELFKYIHGIINKKHCKLFRINGMQDHLHIFSDLHPTVCLSDYIKDIKIASNGWMKDSGRFPNFKGWQDGYGAFTYSIKERDTIINYIKNQKEHHKTEVFIDEFRRLLIENGIEFDDKYLL